MRIRLTFIIASLLLVSMLLVNFVLLIFWQRDAIQREISKDRIVLSRLSAIFPKDDASFFKMSSDHFEFQSFYPLPEQGRIYLYKGEKTKSASVMSNVQPELFARTLKEAFVSRTFVVHYSGSLFNFSPDADYVITLAKPVVYQGKIIGSLGICRSLRSVFQALWQAERTVLVYMIINLFIWTVIGFLRMRSVVMRPIKRLVRLADQYHDQQTSLFVADTPGSEFSVLAGSLNSMLFRIKQDRNTLEQNVKELAATNDLLKKQQKEMIRTEKLASVGRMAAGLAHEIGNPIGVVQGYLGLLKQVPSLDSENHEYIQRANQELYRVNVLIRQLLDFARAPKGEAVEFSLHELLYSVLEMIKVQPSFDQIEVSLEMNAKEDLVFADKDQLRQVFVNCLLNSADAVQEHVADSKDIGSIYVSTDLCDVATHVKGSKFMRVQIRDNGIGIHQDQLSLVFDPFFTTKEPGKGTGLGLSVSLSIIEALNGTMEIESIPGKGTILSMVLPLASNVTVTGKTSCPL